MRGKTKIDESPKRPVANLSASTNFDLEELRVPVVLIYVLNEFVVRTSFLSWAALVPAFAQSIASNIEVLFILQRSAAVHVHVVLPGIFQFY